MYLFDNKDEDLRWSNIAKDLKANFYQNYRCIAAHI